MRRASLLIALSLAASAGEKIEDVEKALGPKAAALRDLMTGANLSEISRANRLKRFHEIRGWDRKMLRKSLDEGREKALARIRKAAREAMETAFLKAGEDPRSVEALSKQAAKARDEWEALRKKGGPEIERLAASPEAQIQWVHRHGFTRSGSDAAAAGWIFSEERAEPVSPEMLKFLAAKGFSEEEAEVLVYLMDLEDQIASRMEAEKAAK